MALGGTHPDFCSSLEESLKALVIKQKDTENLIQQILPIPLCTQQRFLSPWIPDGVYGFCINIFIAVPVPGKAGRFSASSTSARIMVL